jgi:hypothetical protein
VACPLCVIVFVLSCGVRCSGGHSWLFCSLLLVITLLVATGIDDSSRCNGRVCSLSSS